VRLSSTEPASGESRPEAAHRDTHGAYSTASQMLYHEVHKKKPQSSKCPIEPSQRRWNHSNTSDRPTRCITITRSKPGHRSGARASWASSQTERNNPFRRTIKETFQRKKRQLDGLLCRSPSLRCTGTFPTISTSRSQERTPQARCRTSTPYRATTH
jgi:hypothetical protein